MESNVIHIFYSKRCKGISNESCELLSYAYYSIFGRELDNDRIAYGKYGKPFVLGERNFHFNISHSGLWILCAVFCDEIGIDIQCLNSNKLSFFEGLYKKEEVSVAKKYILYRKLLYYTAIWTIKESYFKLLGTGINEQLENLYVLSINPTIFGGKKSIKNIMFYTFLLDNKHVVTIAVNGKNDNANYRIFFTKLGGNNEG